MIYVSSCILKIIALQYFGKKHVFKVGINSEFILLPIQIFYVELYSLKLVTVK